MTSTYILPVGVVLKRIKQILEDDVLLSAAWVEGEISRFQIWESSGHAFFTLKDDVGVLEGTMWKQVVRRQSFIPKVGDQVIVNGSVSIYEQRGQLRFNADVFQPAGVGLLQAQFEALRQRLEAEGLFDESRKRPLPPFPRRIGVATSASGAVWQDIQRVIERRYPLVELILAPTLVQGDQASAAIVAAIDRLQEVEDIDLIIVGRGGGSVEDLWCFNDERVVRAIFACRVPVVSAIGHETDFTLSDYVADLRAPTPSAAAEIVVPHILTLLQEITRLEVTARSLLLASFQERLTEIQELRHRLHQASPTHQLTLEESRISNLGSRAIRAFERTAETAEARISCIDALLGGLDPHAVLRRGFAQITGDLDGRLISRTSQLTTSDTVRARFIDGFAQFATTGIMDVSASKPRGSTGQGES